MAPALTVITPVDPFVTLSPVPLPKVRVPAVTLMAPSLTNCIPVVAPVPLIVFEPPVESRIALVRKLSEYAPEVLLVFICEFPERVTVPAEIVDVPPEDWVNVRSPLVRANVAVSLFRTRLSIESEAFSVTVKVPAPLIETGSVGPGSPFGVQFVPVVHKPPDGLFHITVCAAADTTSARNTALIAPRYEIPGALEWNGTVSIITRTGSELRLGRCSKLFA